MKYLITGVNGMLGKDFSGMLAARGDETIGTDRDVLDITNREAVLRFVDEKRPDVVINAAAYNFVDKVEEPDVYQVALAVNGHGPGYLAEAARNVGARFVHFSSDYVFAGDRPEGYVETDAVAPISKYGETKVAGESAVQDAGGDFYICRTSKLFGKPGLSEESKESFVNLMLRLAEKMPELNIVHEEVGSPTYTPDLAQAALNMLDENRPSGIYHVVNDGPGVTWYEFADEIFTLAGVQVPRNPVPSSEFPKPAQRPKFAALKNTKLPALRSRLEALKEFLGAEDSAQ